jgi:hypothetical protein
MTKLEDALKPFYAEIAQIRGDDLALDAPLAHGIGAEDGVTGLLDSVLELANTNLEFDPARSGTAAKLERRARRRGADDLADVLRAYRAVSRMYPDVLGSGYGGTPEDFEEFRRAVVPSVLAAVAEWAANNRDVSEARSVKAAAAEWDEVVGEATQ